MAPQADGLPTRILSGSAIPSPRDPLHNSTGMYLILADFGRQGMAITETDLKDTTRDGCIEALIHGGYCGTPKKVLAFDPVEGWAREASREIALEIARMPFADIRCMVDETEAFVRKYVPGFRVSPDDEYEWEAA